MKDKIRVTVVSGVETNGLSIEISQAMLIYVLLLNKFVSNYSNKLTSWMKYPILHCDEDGRMSTC